MLEGQQECVHSGGEAQVAGQVGAARSLHRLHSQVAAGR